MESPEVKEAEIEDWFLNSELDRCGREDDSKSEKLAKIALAMNQPDVAIQFLDKKELIAEIQNLQGETEEALRTGEKCNRLFKERMLNQKQVTPKVDTENLLGLLSLKVGEKQRNETKLFRDK